MTAIDIEVLVPMAQKGDRAAWTALVESLRPQLERQAKRLTHTRYPHHSATEFAQDAIVKLIEMPTFLRDSGTAENIYTRLLCYLLQTLKNRVANAIRDEETIKRTPPGPRVPAAADSPAGPPPDPARHAPVELQLDLAAALQLLDRRDRDLIVGVYFEKQTYAELSEKYGLSIDLVRKRLGEARKELGELLQEWK